MSNGMEACGTSHYWGRELRALGHEVKLMPPAYVKPYVKRGKSDATDAEAICEAVNRPTMRFVEVKSLSSKLYCVNIVPEQLWSDSARSCPMLSAVSSVSLASLSLKVLRASVALLRI